jgi:carboxylesterase
MMDDRSRIKAAEFSRQLASGDLSCLVLHGLGGGPYELEPLTTALRKAGVDVLAPELPGHEGPGPKMPASTWKEWAGAALASFDQLARKGTSVAVIGFSTGGTLALELCTHRPVMRQVLMAPFLAIRYTRMLPLRPVTYIRHLARFMPELPRRPPAVRDPQMRRWAARAGRFTTFNLQAASSALELIDTVMPLVPGITTPSLILQGQLDTVVEPQCAVWLYKTLGSPDKALVSLPQSDHLLALDREREQVIKAILEFLSPLGRWTQAPAVARAETAQPSMR